MSGLFGTKSPKATKPTPINGLQVQTSSYGLPVQLRYGRNRGAGQLIDWQGFRAVEHAQKQKTGGKGGGGKSNTSYSYTYNVTPLLALGEGPLQAINRVWKDDAVQTLAQSGFTFLNGSWTQTAWSYMTSKFPTHARAYIGTAYVGGADLDLGDNASLPNYNFDISGLCYIAGKPGAKPGDILTDYLTHAQHGAGFNYLATMAGSDFEKYCLARGIYLSPFEETQRPASDFVNAVAEACNSAVVWSQSKLKLIPYGDETIVGTDGTYTPNLTPMYDITEDDYLSSSKGDNGGYVTIDQKPLEQAYNHIQLEIVDGDNDFVVTVVEAKDQADIDARGLRSKAVIQRHDITDVDIGRDVAQMMLQRELYVINTYTFYLTVRHSLLDLMDLLTINDKVNNIVQQLVRITEIEEQDDGVMIVAEEVLANASHAPKYSTQRGSGYLPDLGVDPGNPEHVQLINAPTLLCDHGGYEMWLAASSSNPNWGGAQVWVSDDNVNYELAGVLTGPSRMGVLTSDVTAYAGGAGAVDGSSVVNVTIDRGYIFPGTDNTRDEFTTICYLASNGGEFISYRDATLTGTLSYSIGNLCRAGYGTKALSHAAGTMFVRLDDCIFRMPYERNMLNKVLYVKLLSYNVYGGALQALSDVTAQTITLKPNTGNGPVRGGDPIFDLLDDADAARLKAVEDMGVDGQLSANEKIRQRSVYNSLKSEQTGLDTQADQYFITTEKANYDNAMSALKTYLRTTVGVLDASYNWTNISGSTAITRTDWDSNWENLYGTRATLKQAIYAAANKFSYGVNLLLNPTGRAGFFGWNGGWIGGSQQTLTTRHDSPVGMSFACATTGTAADQGFSQVILSPSGIGSVTFTMSGMFYTGHMTGGSHFVEIRQTDVNGTEISGAPRYQIFAAIGVNAWQYLAVTFTTVAACRGLSFIVRNNGTGDGGQARWSQLKLEIGDHATPFDASTNAADQLGVPGSGVRIGDARNLRAIIYANYASGWSGLTFSTSTTTTNCAISISAATLRAGSVAVAYNASSINVAGSAGTTKTVYLYYDDDNLNGGSCTPNATTSIITALSGDGRVLLGSLSITYPTSGTTSGGGDKGPCPDENAWVLMADRYGLKPDWFEQAKNVKVGDWLRDTEGLLVEVTGSERKRANRSRVIGTSGDTVTCSSIAPLEMASWVEDIEPGTCIRADMSEGRYLITLAERPGLAERVARVEDVGEGWVQHISCGERRFWIGDHPRKLFGHHNLKPLNP